MGNVSGRHYDTNHNLTGYEAWGQLADDVLSVTPDSTFAQNYGQTAESNILLASNTVFYDTIDRRTQIRRKHFDPAGTISIADEFSVTDYAYHTNSKLLASITDDNGNAVSYTYDTVNRVDTVTDALGNTRLYAYDANGNITSVTDTDISDVDSSTRSYATAYTYDHLNRLIALSDPASNISEYGYDSRNNLTYSKNARNAETERQFDGLNRLRKIISVIGATETIEIEQVYDKSSRLVQKIDGNDNVTEYTYDELNRVTNVLYADGTDVDYTNYDAHGRYENRTDANGTVATYAYDDLNRVTGVTYAPAAGVTGATKAFTYDGLSRMVDAEDDDSVVTFHYD